MFGFCNFRSFILLSELDFFSKDYIISLHYLIVCDRNEPIINKHINNEGERERVTTQLARWNVELDEIFESPRLKQLFQGRSSDPTL